MFEDLRTASYALAHRTKRNLERSFDRASAEVIRPLLHRPEKVFTAIYPNALPAGAIRLLTVLKKDSINGKIHCRLDTYPLNLAPRYDAVTYCWGEDPTETGINCNGFELPIRSNLLAFLRASHDRELPLHPLWIDAICLNQEDIDEKNVQVPLMSSIYKRASRTMIWLGEPDADTEDALLWLTQTIPKWIAEINPEGTASKAVLREDWKAKQHQVQWQAIRSYLSRPWFNRLWCLQEVILSEDIQILSHTERLPVISWSKVTKCLKMLDKLNLNFVWILNDRKDQSEISRREAVESFLASSPQQMDLIRFIYRNFGFHDLSTLGDFMQHRLCHEPVDRIWAMLGVFPPNLVTLVHEANIIDYSEDGKREYWKSYLGFMRCVYSWDSQDFFELVLDAIGRGRNVLLPSWCPDFTRTNSFVHFHYNRKFRAGFIDVQDKSGIESKLSLSNELSILGFQMDIVVKTTSVCDSTEPIINQDSSARRVIYRRAHQWLIQCRNIADTTFTSAESTKALCCTLLAADRDGDDDTCYSDSWLQIHQDFEHKMAATVHADLDHEEITEPHPTDYRLALFSVCHGRKMFVTQNGRIGLGPPDMQEGDIVCIFTGATPIFVLRKVNTKSTGDSEHQIQPISSLTDEPKYELIGDAYIYGLMYGEAFTAPDRGADQFLTLV